MATPLAKTTTRPQQWRAKSPINSAPSCQSLPASPAENRAARLHDLLVAASEQLRSPTRSTVSPTRATGGPKSLLVSVKISSSASPEQFWSSNRFLRARYTKPKPSRHGARSAPQPSGYRQLITRLSPPSAATDRRLHHGRRHGQTRTCNQTVMSGRLSDSARWAYYVFVRVRSGSIHLITYCQTGEIEARLQARCEFCPRLASAVPGPQ
jgi:hypothetical protein